MTPEQIAEWARMAGDDWESTLPSDKAFLARFAELVAAHEREQCRAACIDVNLHADAARKAAESYERPYIDGYQAAAIDCVEAIRATAQQPDAPQAPQA